MQLANKGQADVSITAVLSNQVIGKVFGPVWLEEAKARTWYVGYHQATGPAKQPPRREEAALFLGERPMRTLVVPGAGYNHALGIAARVYCLLMRKHLILGGLTWPHARQLFNASDCATRMGVR